jgi:guanylate kinase
VGDTYQPNESVLSHLPQVTFVAVIGPTAVGKTTLMNAAAARCPALHPILTTTTREPRPEEENDIDFHFRTVDEMNKRIAEHGYVQVVQSPVNDALYATAPEDYATEGIAMMPVAADAMEVFKGLPFKTIRSVYILPPNWDVWQTRIASHGFSTDELERRMLEAGRSLRYALEDPNMLFVVNDDLAQSTLDFTQAALGATSAANPYTSRDLIAQLIKELQNR